MDQEQFWDIIAKTCRSDPRHAEEWDQRLQAALEKLDPDEIIEWNRIFDRLAARAYTVNLWGQPIPSTAGLPMMGFNISVVG